MIPRLIDIGGPFKVLPTGEHEATLGEIESVFAINEHRKKLFNGFKAAIAVFKLAGCKTIFLDGSFVTDKEKPEDYDTCWSSYGVDLNKLDPVFFNFDNKRFFQKQKYFGEFFPTDYIADGFNTFQEYFQKDKYTGKPKGIICIKL